MQELDMVTFFYCSFKKMENVDNLFVRHPVDSVIWVSCTKYRPPKTKRRHKLNGGDWGSGHYGHGPLAFHSKLTPGTSTLFQNPGLASGGL